MTDERSLIVNADDFGIAEGVNRGIIEAHQHGIVTSASLMVRGAAVLEALDLARGNPGLGLGLHIDLGEWTLRDGEWQAVYQYVADGDDEAAAAEVERQVALFIELVGRPPDHLDSHQHVHLSDPAVSAAVVLAAERLGAGVRGRTENVAYLGMYGQDRDGSPLEQYIRPDGYVAAIRSLAPGCTELACHPGYVDGLRSDYLEERKVEIDTLCDPRVLAAIDECGVVLTTWASAGLGGVVAGSNLATG